MKDGEQRVFSVQVWGPVLRTFSAVLEGVEGRVEEWRVGGWKVEGERVVGGWRNVEKRVQEEYSTYILGV